MWVIRVCRALRDGVETGQSGGFGVSLRALEVTAVSRIRGTLGTQEDTRGHDIRPVRDREAPGSNPGPPTKQPLFEPTNKKGRDRAFSDRSLNPL
jgi:hypothetical protein